MRLDSKQFMEDALKKDTYKYVPHGPWHILKGTGKQYCHKCGLIGLNNNFTRWSVDKGCFSELHPQFKSKKRSSLNDRI